MLLTGNGAGSFTTSTLNPGTGAGPNGIVLGDFGLDGSLNIATANQNTGSLSLLQNTAIVGLAGQPVQNVVLARFTDTGGAQPVGAYAATSTGRRQRHRHRHGRLPG